MILTVNNYLSKCDDCGKTTQPKQGYIIKSKKNEIRIHLCKDCLNILLKGNVEKGHNLIPKTLKNITFDNIRATNKNGTILSLSNFAFGWCENLRESKFPFIKDIGKNGANLAILYILQSCKADPKDVANKLNKSGLGYTNWKPESKMKDAIMVSQIDKLGNTHYINIHF